MNEKTLIETVGSDPCKLYRAFQLFKKQKGNRAVLRDIVSQVFGILNPGNELVFFVSYAFLTLEKEMELLQEWKNNDKRS